MEYAMKEWILELDQPIESLTYYEAVYGPFNRINSRVLRQSRVLRNIMSEPYICGKYLEVRHCQSVAEIEVILVVSKVPVINS